MNKRDDVGQQNVAATLRAWGYSVAELAERATPTCDLRATRGNEDILIEVKTLHPSDEERRDFGRSGSVTVQREVARSSGVHSRLAHAASQIRATEPDGHTGLRLVWSRVVGFGETPRSLELYCTLFGIRWFRIVRGPVDGRGNVIPCFFTDRSWFRNHPDVCAEVTQTSFGIGLRVNPFSQQRATLSESCLYKLLASLGGVFDLNLHAAAVGIFVADPGPNAPDDKASAQILFKKYGITVVPMPRESSVATSTTWPGNEMGGSDTIPGSDICASALNIALRLAGLPPFRRTELVR